MQPLIWPASLIRFRSTRILTPFRSSVLAPIPTSAPSKISSISSNSSGSISFRPCSACSMRATRFCRVEATAALNLPRRPSWSCRPSRAPPGMSMPASTDLVAPVQRLILTQGKWAAGVQWLPGPALRATPVAAAAYRFSQATLLGGVREQAMVSVMPEES